MKKTFSVLLGAAIISGCSDPEVDYRQVIDYRGMIFDAKSEEPFTGLVKRYPLKLAAGASIGTCNTEFKEGLKYGAEECFLKDRKIMSSEYVEGKLNGEHSVWDANTGHLTLRAEYKYGKKHGLEERFYNESGERKLTKEWSDGKQEGDEKRWSDSGELYVELDWSGGKYSGYKWRLANSFEQGHSKSCKEVFEDSRLHGEVKCFRGQGKMDKVSTSTDGQIISTAEYANGKLDGSHKVWAADGSLILQDKVDNGMVVQRDYQKIINGRLVAEQHWRIDDIDKARNAYNKSEYMILDGRQLKTGKEGQVFMSAEWKDGRLLSGVYNEYIGYSDRLVSTVNYKGQSKGVIVKDGLEERFRKNGEKLYQIQWDNGQAAILRVFERYGQEATAEHPAPKAKDWACTMGCSELNRYVATSLEQSKFDLLSLSPFEVVYENKIY